MCLLWISEVLPPLVSHCLPASAPVLDGVSAFLRSCLAWSSFLRPFVGWYARFPVLSPLVSCVSHCLQLSVMVSPHVSPPSRGLVSPCVPSCFPLLDGASAVPLLWIISHCLPFCFPLLDGVPSRGLAPLVRQLVSQLARLSFSFLFPLVSAFPRPWLPCLPYQFVSQLVSLSWMVRASSQGLVSQLVSQFVFVLVSLCLMVRPPSRGFVSLFLSLSPSLSPFLFPFVGWCVRLPPCLPLSPFFFPFVGWFVRLPESLSRLSPSLCTSLLEGASAFLRSCLYCLPAFFPSLSSSLFLSLPPSLSPSLSPSSSRSLSLPCSPAKVIARRELRRLESSQSSGIENDVSSFTFILRCFQHIQFDSPMLLDSSVWNQILAPPSNASFVVFRHLVLQQRKRNRTNKTNVYKVVCGTFYRYFQ